MSIFGAEVIGTAILILFGGGVVAATLLNFSKAQNSGWIVIAWGWGMGVAIAAFAVGPFSGAHLNPAVTLGLAVAGNTEWGDVPEYFAGEFVGAFIGAVLVYLAYINHWRPTEDPGLKLAVFSTAPAIRDTPANVITEVIGTFILVFALLAFGVNEALGETGLGALIAGLLVLAIGLSLGGPTGYAINPARDLAPRIAHAVLPIPGKGGSDWSYAWIPVVGPLIGGALGGLAFELFFPG